MGIKITQYPQTFTPDGASFIDVSEKVGGVFNTAKLTIDDLRLLISNFNANYPLNFDFPNKLLTIIQASSNDNGFLSSADYTLFFNKPNKSTPIAVNTYAYWQNQDTLASGALKQVGDETILDGLNTTSLMRITQRGSGNALIVEDSTSPDATPFVVDGSGNVGIGNSTPATLGKLVVASTGTNGLVLDSDTLAPQNSTRLFLKSSTASKDLSIFNVAGALRFVFAGSANVSSGSSKFIMNETGNMLFNSTGSTITPVAPITAYATGVTGQAEEIGRFTTYKSTSPGTLIGSYFSIRNQSTADDEFVTLLRGIQSATSTLSSLYIDGLIDGSKDTAGNTEPCVVVRAGTTLGITLANRPLFDFRNWVTSCLLINAQGNVGIGTTTPAVRLNVSGYGRFQRTTIPTQYVEIRQPDSNEIGAYSAPSNAKPLIFNATTDDLNTPITVGSISMRWSILGNEFMRLLSNGNLGIGTLTPTSKLHIYTDTAGGGFKLRDTTNAVNTALLCTTSDGEGRWGKVTSTYTTGASGSFTSADGKTITVTNGLITSIV